MDSRKIDIYRSLAEVTHYNAFGWVSQGCLWLGFSGLHKIPVRKEKTQAPQQILLLPRCSASEFSGYSLLSQKFLSHEAVTLLSRFYLVLLELRVPESLCI